MRYLSVCSGIEAATVAWHPLGWQAVAFSEIDPFACAVLRHRWPDVPLHGDFTELRGDEHGPVDVLVGGTPCQDFSVAGLRAGITGERGNLTLDFLRLAGRLRPAWVVWENVPGVLSLHKGRAFGAVLGGLAQLGYGFAYRILDAQYFGLAQRRERVFVVGHLGDWRRAAAVLFERESLHGHPAPRREAGQSVAPTLAARTKGGGGLGTDFDCDGGLIANCFTSSPSKHRSPNEDATLVVMAHGQANAEVAVDQCPTLTLLHEAPILASTLTARRQGGSNQWAPWNEADNLIAHSLRADGFDASEDGTGRGTPLVAFQSNAGSQGGDIFEEMSPTLRVQKNGGGGMPAIAGMQVRRLTPRECERLQGFPDDYTLIPWRKGMAPDGPRYKALGNSMAVPVMRWIGERIQAVDKGL